MSAALDVPKGVVQITDEIAECYRVTSNHLRRGSDERNDGAFCGLA